MISNAYPGKFLLVVDTQTSGLFMRAYVSCGPPRHAAQDGEAGVSHPASSKIWAAVFPSQPATGSVYTSAQTFCVAGTRYLRPKNEQTSDTESEGCQRVSVRYQMQYVRRDLDLLSGLVEEFGSGLEVLSLSSSARTDVNAVYLDIAALSRQLAVVW